MERISVAEFCLFQVGLDVKQIIVKVSFNCSNSHLICMEPLMSKELKANHICVVVIHCQQSDDNLTDVNDTYPWKPELCHCANCLTAFLSY